MGLNDFLQGKWLETGLAVLLLGMFLYVILKNVMRNASDSGTQASVDQRAQNMMEMSEGNARAIKDENMALRSENRELRKLLTEEITTRQERMAAAIEKLREDFRRDLDGIMIELSRAQADHIECKQRLARLEALTMSSAQMALAINPSKS